MQMDITSSVSFVTVSSGAGT